MYQYSPEIADKTKFDNIWGTFSNTVLETKSLDFELGKC